MLDGSIIKVHQDAMRSCYDKAAEAIGSSVGGLSTKIHAKVDSFGQLVNILITPGQVHESQVANDVWANEHCNFFLADKAYDIDSFVPDNFLKGKLR
ncbi:TPA: transposase [Legionella pneumophila]